MHCFTHNDCNNVNILFCSLMCEIHMALVAKLILYIIYFVFKLGCSTCLGDYPNYMRELVFEVFHADQMKEMKMWLVITIK